MNKAEDIEQLIYRELPPDRYCYIHNFILEKDKEIEKLADGLEEQERHIKEADYEIEKLNNIIKEAREILINKRRIFTMQLLNGLHCDFEELLYQVDEEIGKVLNKVEENKDGNNI